MQPFASCPVARLSAVRGVLTDIDDTLTVDGAIAPAALHALHVLHEARIPVIAITGRPAGWSEPFALQWPVRAIVAENGAVMLRAQDGELRRDFTQDTDTRTANFARLQRCANAVLAELPGTRMATDSAGRLTDIAVDHSEFAHLDEVQIAQVVALMHSHGLHATVSSIHINGWYGDHTKLSGARWMLQRLFRRSLDSEVERWVYVGDSTNDQAMFGHFPLSVGVANLRRFADQLHTWPAYITQGQRGAGFAEVAARLLVRTLA